MASVDAVPGKPIEEHVCESTACGDGQNIRLEAFLQGLRDGMEARFSEQAAALDAHHDLLVQCLDRLESPVERCHDDRSAPMSDLCDIPEESPFEESFVPPAAPQEAWPEGRRSLTLGGHWADHQRLTTSSRRDSSNTMSSLRRDSLFDKVCSSRSFTDETQASTFHYIKSKTANVLNLVTVQSDMSTERESGLVGRIVKSPQFDMALACVIAVNAFIIGLHTELMSQERHRNDPPEFKAAETIVCVIFAAELFARVWVFRCQFLSSVDWRWNVFDSVIVAHALMEEVVKYVIEPPAAAKKLSGLTILRVLRVLKIVRVLRVIRMFRFFRELRIMGLEIASTFRSLFWTLVLMLMVMYVFGIHITTEVLNHEMSCGSESTCESEELHPLFGSLTRTIVTLYQSVLGGLDWGQVSDSLARMSWYTSAVFIVYVTFVIFAIMNIITGLFVEQAKKATEQDIEHVLSQTLDKDTEHADKLEQIFRDADADGNGQVTWTEMRSHLEDPRVQAYFKTIGIDWWDLKTFFDLLHGANDDAETGIDIRPFVHGCMRLKGKAKSVDVMAMRYELSRLQAKLVQNISNIEMHLCRKHSKDSPMRNSVSRKDSKDRAERPADEPNAQTVTGHQQDEPHPLGASQTPRTRTV